jgi:hypothetical protein
MGHHFLRHPGLVSASVVCARVLPRPPPPSATPSSPADLCGGADVGTRLTRCRKQQRWSKQSIVNDAETKIPTGRLGGFIPLFCAAPPFMATRRAPLRRHRHPGLVSGSVLVPMLRALVRRHCEPAFLLAKPARLFVQAGGGGMFKNPTTPFCR